MKKVKEANAVVVPEKAVAVKEVNTSPSNLIEIAISKGANLEQVEKLLKLKRDFEADEARKVYNAQMVIVQSEIPVVIKTKKNPQTHSKYAALDKIIEQAKQIYTKHGFSISFYEGETAKPEHIRICADVVHSAGHKETYHYDIPLDGMGIKGNANMTAIHAKASSTSYAWRYLMCMIWNIPTGDDDDGQAAGMEYIDDKQKSTLVDMMTDTKTDIVKFCKAFEIEELVKLPKAKYQQAVAALNRKAEEMKKAEDKKNKVVK